MKEETARTLIRVVVGVFIAGVGFGMAGWAWAGADPNEVAAWVEATATTLALLGATAAAIFAFAAFGLETRREDRYVETQRRAQASVVAAWADTDKAEMFPNQSGIRRQLGIVTVHGFRLRNASDVPVTAVEVKAFCGSDLLGVQYLGLLPPDHEAKFYSWDKGIADQLREMRQTANGAGGYDEFTPEVALAFVDAAGVAWVRDEYGELTEGWWPEG